MCTQCGENPDGSPNKTIKSLGASGWFLTGIIVYTVALVVAILSSINVSFEIYEQKVNPATSIKIIAFIWSGILPAVFIAVGLWMIYASARNRTKDRMNPRGLTVIRGVMLFWRNVTVVALISLGLAVFCGDRIVWQDVPWSEKLCMLLFVVAMLTTALIYYVKAADTIAVIKESIKKDMALTKGISSFVVVINIIVGVMLPLACVMITAQGMHVLHPVWIEVFLSFSTAAVYIFFGVYTLRYKRRLEFYRYQNRAPVQTDTVADQSQ